MCSVFRSLDERTKQRMRRHRLTQKLRVKLATHKKRMARNLDHFDEINTGFFSCLSQNVLARNEKSLFFKTGTELIRHLVTVTVTFRNRFLTVSREGLSWLPGMLRLNLTGVST